MPHRGQGIGREQGAHPFPEQAFASQLGPHRLKQGTTALLRLIDEKCQHHHEGKHPGEMLRAMPIVVCKVVALVFQGIERLVFDFPPGAAPAHEVIDMPLVHPDVSHPAEVLDLLVMRLPILNEIDVHSSVGGVEGHLIDKPEAMHQARGAVVPRIMGDTARAVRSLDLLEQPGMIPGFHPKDIVQMVGV